MTTKRLVTKEELNWLFTSPGCDNVSNNGKGGYCANGKFLKLGVIPKLLVKRFRVETLNNVGIESFDYLQNPEGSDSYGPDSPKWAKHERALKLGIQYMLEDGKIELEDEAAKEFSELLKKEPVCAA